MIYSDVIDRENHASGVVTNDSSPIGGNYESGPVSRNIYPAIYDTVDNLIFPFLCTILIFCQFWWGGKSSNTFYDNIPPIGYNCVSSNDNVDRNPGINDTIDHLVFCMFHFIPT